MQRLLPVVLLLLLPSLPVFAQEGQAAEGCTGADFDLTAVDPAALAAPAGLTEAEQQVQQLIARDGVHVVHFWAPWCDNSISELRNGWYDLIERNPEVSFTFVTAWNDGQSGQATMQRFAIPGRVVELTLPDFGPSSDETQRRRQFMGLPLTWLPSTWVFHHNGELAFALNYGEMQMETLQHLLDTTRQVW